MTDPVITARAPRGKGLRSRAAKARKRGPRNRPRRVSVHNDGWFA